jgi:hypothetical protein
MAELVIDPRDFITGPFRQCPKCGGNEFGILMISGGHYIRRCRDRKCWHTLRTALPEIRKTVIYIDQFAISNMMKALNPVVKGHERAAAEPFWLRLFETLDVLSKQQLIVCPDSHEHRNESLLSPFYPALKKLYELLSHGTSLKDADSIRHDQIACAAKAWIRGEKPEFDFDPEDIAHDRLHKWNDRLYITVNVNYGDFVEGMRAARDKVHEGLSEVFADWQAQKRQFHEWRDIEAASYGPMSLKVYADWINQRLRMEWGAEPFDIDRFFPPRCAALVMGLVSIFQREGFSEADSFAKAGEFLRSQALTKVPFNNIAASLYAVLAMKAGAGQKEPPNRGTAADINIVSTLLPYCDAMFIDNKCRALLQDIPQEHALPYKTQVFSPNTGEDFIGYLNTLREQCCQDHVRMVDELYGAQSLKPYTAVFTREQSAS